MFGLQKFGDGISISRLLRFLDAHHIDLDRLANHSIVVTGSNGKGSTSRFLAAALSATNRRTGLFTSPHLFDVRERFLINDDRISQPDFDRHAKTVLAFANQLPDGDRMGGFEFLFLLAVLWFEEQRPEAMVWEAGIGGRYDPVRIVRAKLGILTGLELEHTQILGATEELIAYDKIDAVAPHGRLIVSPSVAAEHYPRIAAYCRLTSKQPSFVAQDIHVDAISNTAAGTRFTFHDHDRVPAETQLRLIGPHQVDNALTAWRAALAWLPAADPAQLLHAIATASWPGRLERVATNPDLWIDVGHTPKALDLVTSAFLDYVPRERTLVVFGVSASKEIAGIAKAVASKFDRFILTKAHKSGADPSAFAQAFAGKDVTLAPDTATAARLARDRAQRENLTVLAAGGLFLAAEIQHAWAGADPTKLDFF